MKKMLTILPILLVLALLPQAVHAQAEAVPAKKETLKTAKKAKVSKKEAKLKAVKKEEKKTIKKLEMGDKESRMKKERSKIPGPSKDKPAEAVVKPINRGTVNGEPIVRKKKKDNEPKQVVRKKDN